MYEMGVFSLEEGADKNQFAGYGIIRNILSYLINLILSYMSNLILSYFEVFKMAE